MVECHPDSRSVDVLVLDLGLASARGVEVQGRRRRRVRAGRLPGPDLRQRDQAGRPGRLPARRGRGLVHKTEPRAALHKGIEAVAAGRTVVTPAVAGLLDAIARLALGPLITERQAAVLNGRARGETFAAIGRWLGISPRTAKEYMALGTERVASFVAQPRRHRAPARLSPR